MATTPQAVARALKAAGFLTSPRGRQGVHVTRSFGGASVDIDIDAPAHRARLAVAAVKALTAAGYDVQENVEPGEPERWGGVHLLHVSRDA